MANDIMTDAFKRSVDKKDIAGIRTCITEHIYRDPTFATGRYEAEMDYTRENGVDIAESYQKRSDEFELPKEKWDDSYFYHMVEWFRLNFAPDERIPTLKQVGQKVFVEDKHISPEIKMTNPHFQTVLAKRTRKTLPIPALVGSIIAVIAIVVLIIELFQRH